MTALDIQIIGRLFDFLSSYEPEELSKAASSSLVTDNVRGALLALARARAEHRAARAPSPTASPANGVSRQSEFLESEVQATLSDTTILPTSADVVSALERVGIRVVSNRKDGRARVVERAKREFSHLPPRERDRRYKQLLRELRPTETEGWFKVIRGET